MFSRAEMLEVGGDRRPGAGDHHAGFGERSDFLAHAADAVVLATGGYGNVFYLSTNAPGLQCHGDLGAPTRRARPLRTRATCQIHPTCIPVTGDHQSKLTLMSESLRNDGRMWVPQKKGDQRRPDAIPEGERDYFLEREIPELRRNLAPARHRLAGGEGGVRRRTGRGARRRQGFTSRILRTPSGGWRKRPCGSATGIFLTCMMKITGGKRVSEPDAHISGGALQRWGDVGGLPPDEQPAPGCLCWGEANFSGITARTVLATSALMQQVGGRLFHPAVYTTGNYFALREAGEGDDGPSGIRSGSGREARRRSQSGRGDQRAAQRDVLSSRVGQADVGQVRHGAQRGQSGRRPCAGFPSCGRNFGRM